LQLGWVGIDLVDSDVIILILCSIKKGCTLNACVAVTSSTSFGSYKQLRDATSTSTLAKKTLSPHTPAWKLIGGTLKLLGLVGFWAFDNLSFLTSSGF